MSWDIRAVDPGGDQVLLPEQHELRGGTYALGGTNEAWLNVTYNYGKHFNFGALDEVAVATAVPEMEQRASELARDTSECYWEPTEGNVRLALESMIALSALVLAECPQAVWRVS